MMRRPPTAKRTATLLPDATLVRSLAAAMNGPWLAVRRRPRIAVLATGDELVRPGDPVGENQIVSSNNIGIAALIEAHGGTATDLGIARDTEADLRSKADAAAGHDLLDTLRSEEHTSELQSLMRISYAVFCLKKKNHHNTTTT